MQTQTTIIAEPSLQSRSATATEVALTHGINKCFKTNGSENKDCMQTQKQERRMNRNWTLLKQQGQKETCSSWSRGLSLSQTCTMRPMNSLAVIRALTHKCKTGHRSHNLYLCQSQESNPLSDRFKLFLKLSPVLSFSSLNFNRLPQWFPFCSDALQIPFCDAWAIFLLAVWFSPLPVPHHCLGNSVARKEMTPLDP